MRVVLYSTFHADKEQDQLISTRYEHMLIASKEAKALTKKALPSHIGWTEHCE